MPIRDYYLLSPEISLASIAMAVILLDTVVKRKGLLAIFTLAALALPLAFTISLWGEEGRAFGGLLIVDQFSIFFKFLFLGVTAAVVIASQDSVTNFKRFQGEFYALLLLATSGLMLMSSTGELITIFLALELSTLSAIALVTFFKTDQAVEAGIKYLVLSGISSAMMLYGMALVFGVSGSTRLEEIAQAVGTTRLLDNPALLMGMLLMVAGFGFKISSVPFQMWVPDVYQGAPTSVAAYLSVASKAGGFAVILRVFYVAFAGVSMEWSMLFAVLAVVSMTFGNLIAMFQSNIKRLLAYSTIAHAGYMMVGLAAVAARNPIGEGLGTQGLLFYLTGYAFTNLGAFFVVIAVAQKLKGESIDDFAGLAKRSPLLAGLLALCLISLTGLPPTVGFWAKLYLFSGAVQADLVWLAVAGVLNSAISAYYYLRVVKAMYMSPAASDERLTPSPAISLALLVTTGGVLFFGFAPSYLLDFAVRAARGFPG
ncbi:MAG: NADH-quinone oxidoreductase subunit N [Dehalococcoidia bacterium]|nr:NADH-quinone oxidoreductase subunit N [Dehalococcoidia bacterium]